MTSPQDPNQGPDQGPYGQQPMPGSYPAPPPLSEPDTQTLEPPTEVKISFWLWIAGAVLSLLAPVLLFASRDELLTEARRTQGGELSQAELETIVNATIGFVAVFFLIFAGLFVLFAFKMKAGRNWARITLTVLTAIIMLFTLGSSLTGLIPVLVSIVAIVLMFLPKANAYFQAAKRVA
ncbi:hypothetical protein [Longimycelium tulufanense]|nr:hypothetical protein [Longimycelium tulufanense]